MSTFLIFNMTDRRGGEQEPKLSLILFLKAIPALPPTSRTMQAPWTIFAG
jgi:hypothetical protein